ncbi:MAG: mercury transporter MerT [Deltaproteobacteria bacterium]|nr:mercury transporter MerT [Deltaproteobacteria bacterium]
METIKNNPTQKSISSPLFGAGLLAILASSCCLLPLLLVSIGIGGAWMGSLTALEPYRPIFITITLLLLAFAFYRVYRKPKIECACDDAPKQRTRKILWIVTVIIVALLAFPYFLPLVYGGTANNAPAEKQVVLTVSNMTCFACTLTIKKALTRLDGVNRVKVTRKPPEAKITYDPARVTVKDLITATTNAGYPSAEKVK